MRVNIDDTSQDDGFTYTYEGRTFTGDVVDVDADGNVVSSTPVVDGVPNGVERAWYADGTLQLEVTLVDGIAVGTARRWHANGRLAEEREVDQRGELVAVRAWDEDGRPIEG